MERVAAPGTAMPVQGFMEGQKPGGGACGEDTPFFFFFLALEEDWNERPPEAGQQEAWPVASWCRRPEMGGVRSSMDDERGRGLEMDRRRCCRRCSARGGAGGCGLSDQCHRGLHLLGFGNAVLFELQHGPSLEERR